MLPPAVARHRARLLRARPARSPLHRHADLRRGGVGALRGVGRGEGERLGPLAAIALGASGAVGGGILRDVLANELPTVFRSDSERYAVPAILGATIVVAAGRLGLYGLPGRDRRGPRRLRPAPARPAPGLARAAPPPAL